MRDLICLIFCALGMAGQAQNPIGRLGDTPPKYYAILICAQSYNDKNFPSLSGPSRDVLALKDILVNSYSFEEKNVLVLKDKSKDDILDKIESVTKTLSDNDNLLIFYSGHGTFKTGINSFDYQGFWVPSDGVKGKFHTYISSDELYTSFRGCKAKHILLITDACFGGAMKNIPSAPMDI